MKRDNSGLIGEVSAAVACRGGRGHLRKDRLIQPERVKRRGERPELVELEFGSQVGSLASNIGKGGNHIPRQLAFYAETPLLRVRPNRFGGNRGDVDGICPWLGGTECARSTRASDACVTRRE